MAESIESFVAKLQAEGVAAGQETARKLQAEAEGKASDIVAQAKSQAEKLLADARIEADNLLARSRTEVELAARDVALRLREALGRALQAILLGSVKEQLSGEEFLKTLIHDVVLKYVSADREGAASVSLNVPEALAGQLGEWITQELQKADGKPGGGVDLKATLKQAGFEYSTTGGTVEVTVDSVVASLRELVGVSLRERLDRALDNQEG